MASNFVITIGRQFGSGGRQIGKLLADKLNIPYYDKEILTVAAKDSGICEELFQTHDEKPTRSLIFSLVTGMGGQGGYADMPLNHKIFLAQFDAIRRVAGEGPCVIVGRCADYVLRDMPNAVKLFVKADMAVRKQRAMDLGIEAPKAEEYVRKQDKNRASYYNYYATAAWGDVNNYDLCLDTGKLGIEGSAEMVMAYLDIREKAMKGTK